MTNNPLVSICCITYNHGAYIKKCIEGFLIQNVKFTFEILIYDDASTDDTSIVIREYQKQYPEIIFPVIASTNQYSKGVRGINLLFNFPRARGKYIALCEGDDYWIDPLKLHKQVETLEKNPNISLCCHAWKVVNEVGELISDYEPSNFIKPSTTCMAFSLEDFSKRWITKSLSIIFPLSALDDSEIIKYEKPVDKHLYYTLLKNGKGIFINEVMGAYRVHSGGVVSLISTKKKLLTILEIANDIYTNNPNEPVARKMYLSALQRQINFNIHEYGYFNSLNKNRSHFAELAHLIKSPRDIRHLILAVLPKRILRIKKR